MYSNEKRSGFSILDLLVKVIFVALFIFLLIWLFNKKVPNMKPFYSNVFRENIKYMEESGESYFTTDRLPKEVGESKKLSLSEMYSNNLVLPFVDKDGKACDENDSYVSVTKFEDYYELKTNLVCKTESNYTVKILGCHKYCDDKVICNCGSTSCGNTPNVKSTCTREKITLNQFRKLTTKTSTTYSCPKGYKLSKGYCVKTSLIDSKSAKVTKDVTKTVVIDATMKVISGTKTKVDTIVKKEADKTEKVYVNAVANTTSKKVSDTVIKNTSNTKVNDTVVKNTSSTKVNDTVVVGSKKTCSTTYQKQAYSCNCTSSVGATGKTVTKCSTCYKSVPVETCNTSTTYSCPSVSTDKSGSGSSLSCWHYTSSTTYSCPSNATGSSGSGSNLSCWYYKTIPGKTTYSCPSNANYKEGSGSTLKCYVVTDGKVDYSCPDEYTLKGDKCYKTVTSTEVSYKCSDGYKLVDKTCKKYKTTKVKATAKKKTSKGYVYTWSEKSSLKGWSKTGRTRVSQGKLICK